VKGRGREDPGASSLSFAFSLRDKKLTLNLLLAFQKAMRSFLNLLGGRCASRISERMVGGKRAIEKGGGGVRKETTSERTSSGRKGRGGMLVIQSRVGSGCVSCHRGAERFRSRVESRS